MRIFRVFIVGWIVLLGTPVSAQCESQKIKALDADVIDLFGFAVSLDGTTAVVGAPQAFPGGDTGYGAAYVFTFDGTAWSQTDKLVSSDIAPSDDFGESVGVDGDVIIVGTPRDDDFAPFSNSGSAYMFRHDGIDWVQEQKLTANDAAEGDFFGSSVSVSGDLAVVGASSADVVSTSGECCDQGAAYVFRYNGSAWVQEAKLIASDTAPNDRFGVSVSASGTVIVVGAFGNNDAGSQSGSAYVFRFNGTAWVEEQKLTASDASVLARFGLSVSIDQDRCAIGAPGFFGNPPPGSAYVFSYDGSQWLEEQKLMASDAAPADYFGASVSLRGDTVVVGAEQTDDLGEGSGAAYVYRFQGLSTEWIETEKLLAGDGEAGNSFGNAVALGDDVALVGAYHDGEPGISFTGSAYFFDVNCGRSPFVRGDCNDDGAFDIADGVFLLNYLFHDGPIPDCQVASDVNGDGLTDSADAIYVFNYQFFNGAPPPVPFPECDFIESGDCASYGNCE